MKKTILLLIFVLSLFIETNRTQAQTVPTPNVSNCGVRSVLNFAKYLGHTTSDAQLALICEANPQPNISMYNVQQAAKQIGIRLQGVKTTIEELEKKQQPFIAVLPDHFVFVERIEGPWVLYIESNGLEIRSRASFVQDYQGMALVLAPHEAENKLRISSLIEDWGRISAGTAEKKVIVTLENTGSQSIKIKNITTSCSCTVPSKWPNHIEPGQKIPLTITVQLPDSGEFSETVTVFSNAAYPSQMIFLKGEVESDLQFAPAQLNFGDVVEGHNVMKTLVFQDKYHKMPRPFKVSASSTVFTAELQLQSENSWNIAVTLNAPTESRAIVEELLISGIKPESRVVHIPITATIVPMTRSHPPKAVFGSVNSDTAVRILQVSRQDNRPFEITEIKSPSYIYCDIKPLNSRRTEWQVTLNLTRTQAPDQVKAQLTIMTKYHNKTTSLSVPVLAMVR